MNMKIYFIIGLAFLLILSGCGQVEKPNETNQVNCDDNNECTEDIVPVTSDGSCTYRDIKPCCGNKMCEAGEGCNVATKITGCSKDCGTCIADVKIGNRECTGECTLAPDSFRIKGDSNLFFEFENLGEDPVTLNAELSCARQGAFGKVNFGFYGYSISNYFENNENSMLINGKSKSKYQFTLTGKTTSSVNLECNLYLKSASGLSNFADLFFLKLE